MYRQYEDPRALEKQLEEVEARQETCLDACTTDDERFEVIESFAEIIADLKERINFAWQDDEYEADCRYNAYNGFCY